MQASNATTPSSGVSCSQVAVIQAVRPTKLPIDEFYEGLEKRDQTVDAGIALTYQGQWGKIRVDWLTDILDRHNGQEVELA